MRPVADVPPQDESLAGAFGIPEYMPPIRRRTSIVKTGKRFDMRIEKWSR